MPWFPRKVFHDWPDDAVEIATPEVIKMYENGFAGAKYSPAAKERFRAEMQYPLAEDIAHRFGFADTGKDKLVIPFVLVMEMFPNCWPGLQGQGRGDCVSWSTRNALLGTMTCDIATGAVDQRTGKLEEKPDVPADGIADGVLSTEAIYWYRGYDGDGWFCPEAAQFACQKTGCVVRKDYPDLGVNLTKYSSKTAGAYGRRSPPANIADMTNDHMAHQATEATSFEAARDLLFNGFFLTTCGGEGLSDTRDEWGVARRSGSWSHAMAYIGCDDRPEIKQKYNEPLVLDLNSWAKWNKGPRDIFDSAKYVPAAKKDEWVRAGIVNASTGNIMIPEGSCWVRYSEMRNRDMHAFAGVAGWEARTLPLNTNPF
jgi:hypothetical protein